MLIDSHYEFLLERSNTGQFNLLQIIPVRILKALLGYFPTSHSRKDYSHYLLVVFMGLSRHMHVETNSFTVINLKKSSDSN